MRIAITADPEIPVPPQLYGGIERIIDMLVQGLVQAGHEVTLFAHPDSKVSARLIPYPGLRPQHPLDTLRNTWTITREVAQGRFDLIHSFGRLVYLLPVLPLKLPKLMSYQREPTLQGIQKAIQLSRKGTLTFTGCSEYIAAKIRPYAPTYAIHNGVPLDIYDFQESVAIDAPLVFLGRIEHIKGTHLAIEIARATQERLIIAGNVPADPQSQTYFKTHIEPFVDGEQITYVGPVNDEQKNQLLGNAKAFLMPILWDEPFGIVMAEAMACGTPVIGLNRGAVPEIIENGVSGFRCNNVEEMKEAVKKTTQINRSDVRTRVKQHFSETAIVNKYVELYQKLMH